MQRLMLTPCASQNYMVALPLSPPFMSSPRPRCDPAYHLMEVKTTTSGYGEILMCLSTEQKIELKT